MTVHSNAGISCVRLPAVVYPVDKMNFARTNARVILTGVMAINYTWGTQNASLHFCAF